MSQVRRLHLGFTVLALLILNALFAIYVFNYTTEVLDPEARELAGVSVLYLASTGLAAYGTEDGWVLSPWMRYKNDAPITSIIMTDDGLMVAFADSNHTVRLLFAGIGVILWNRSFDGPVQLDNMWVRPGPYFLEPTFILVSYDGGFSLLWAPEGTTLWRYESDEPFVMRSTETGKIIVGSGASVSFFYLGSGEPYRTVPVEGPVVDVLPDVKGNYFLIVRDGESLLYDGILGDILWRRSIEGPVQGGLSWNAERSLLLSQGRLEIVSMSGELLSTVDVGEGELLVPTASAYFFLLREDRIEAYYNGRPAPIWTAAIDAPFQVLSNSGGTVIFAWTSDTFFLLDNTTPPLASRVWTGAFGTVIVVQIALSSLFILRRYPLPNVGDLTAAVVIALLASAGVLLTGALESFVELGVTGAFVAAFGTSMVSAVVGRRSGSPIPGLAVGLAVGMVGFLAASLLVAFYLYVFESLLTFPAIEVSIRSLTLGWLLGLVSGLLGGLSAYMIPDFLRSFFSRD